MEEKETIDMVLVGFVLVFVLMALGSAILLMQINILRTDIKSLETDHREQMDAVFKMYNSLNEDMMAIQMTIPEFDAELSEYRSILRNTNHALARLSGKTYSELMQQGEQEETENEKVAPVQHKSEMPEEMTEIYVSSSAEDAAPEGMTYIGTWDISAYEWSDQPCANGNWPTVWYTCALNGYPFGTTVYIDGLGYFVNEDICGTPGRLDIFLGDVDDCKQFGIQSHDVYIVN